MPVSSTATTTPLPVNEEVSAPTALTPHAVLVAAGAATPGTSTGAISTMGITGATATTSDWRLRAGRWRESTSSTSIDIVAGVADSRPDVPSGPGRSRAATLELRRTTCFSPIGLAPPRFERVVHAVERGPQFRIVTLQHVEHRGLTDIVQPELRIDLRPEIVGEESVALEAAGGHQHEHPERRVAEAEPFGQRFGEQPGHQVHLLEVVVVDPFDFVPPHDVVGELVERLHRVLVEQAPELVV